MGNPEKPTDVEMGDMSEEAKLNPTDVDVKTSSDLKNGDVKEPRFTGLKKEELLKISNQKKWVNARWVLFILFWVIWLAMLVGAILIVVNAPRCKPEPKPEWYQDTAVYEANPKSFADGLEGTKDHLPYIEALHATTLLLTGASDPDDPKAVLKNDDEKFKELVKAVHDKSGKIIVDVVVDSISTSNANFIKSASADCAGNKSGEFCDLVVWQSTNNSQSVFHAEREEAYIGNQNRAALNYGSEAARNFIMDVISSWFQRGVDGVKIRDTSKLENIGEKEFVSILWNKFFVKNETAENEETVRALYVYSSSPNAESTPTVLADNDTNTAHSPVFLNDEITSVINESEAGEKIKNILNNWRNQARNIPGYLISPVGSGLAAKRFGNFSAGLNLLSLCLPGVPFVQSGDERAATSPDFTWSDGEFRDSVPLNGSSYVYGQTEELIVRRVEGIQAMQSLRYDTRSNDTIFEFLKTDKDVIAFKRKWDKKSAVLVVSNMSPNNHTVNLMVENGLMENENELKKRAKVQISSLKGYVEEINDLEKVPVWSGLTLLLI